MPLSARYSADAFASDHDLSEREVDRLVDAARWAPSAGNSQPWGFYVVRRGTGEHDSLAVHLAPSSRRWALDAAVLIVTATRRYTDDPAIPYSEFSDYDLGQAVAHLTFEAHAMGLSCHQFRAFDLDGLTNELRPAPGWAIVSMIACGVAAGPPSLQRTRRSVRDVLDAPWQSEAIRTIKEGNANLDPDSDI